MVKTYTTPRSNIIISSYFTDFITKNLILERIISVNNISYNVNIIINRMPQFYKIDFDISIQQEFNLQDAISTIDVILENSSDNANQLNLFHLINGSANNNS